MAIEVDGSPRAAARFPEPFLKPAADAPVGPPEAPHVLLVVDGFPKSLGGGERVVLRLAALLPRYGFRASILTFAVHPESVLLRSAPPCPVYLLPLQRTYDLRALRAALALRGFLHAEDVRIVQTFFESSDLWAGLVTKLFSRAKLIWSRRDMGILRGRKHEVAYRRLRRLPDAVFAVSEQVRRHVIAVDGVAPERVQTVYNGLDVSADAESPARPTESPVVTTVGNIRRVKGHDVLVEAAARVAERVPQVQFTVAGEVLEPEYFAELQQQVAAKGLGGSFHFLGGVTDLPPHLRGASVFVLPSRSEGFSNAIVEAMAAGLPVVATDVGGNAEAVEDGVSGYIVPAEDAAALAAGVARLLGDPELASRMGAAGKRRAQELFTTEAMMDRTTTVYRTLLGV